MLERYARLKTRGVNPPLSLIERSDPINASNWLILLTYNKHDEETGEVSQQVDKMTLEELVTRARKHKKLWLAAKEIYETLKGEPFPN